MVIKNDFVALLTAQIALNSLSVNYTGLFTIGRNFPAGVDSINIIEAMFDSCIAENEAGGGAICCSVKGPMNFTVTSTYFYKCKSTTIDSKGGAIYYFNASHYECKNTCFYGCSASIGHFQYVDSPSHCDIHITHISSINSDSLVYGLGSESTKITGGRINLLDGNFSDNSVSMDSNGAGLSVGSETLVNIARMMFQKNNGYSTLYLEKSPLKYNLQYFNFVDNSATSDINVLGTYQIYQTYFDSNMTKFIAECQDGSLLLYGVTSKSVPYDGEVNIISENVKKGPFQVAAFATGECIENKQGSGYGFHVPSATPLTNNFVFSAGNAFVILSLIVLFIAIVVFSVYAVLICCFKRPHIFSSIKYIEENRVPLLADEVQEEVGSVHENVVEDEVIADPEKEIENDTDKDALASVALSSMSSRRMDTSDQEESRGESMPRQSTVIVETIPIDSQNEFAGGGDFAPIEMPTVQQQATDMVEVGLLDDSEAEVENSSSEMHSISSSHKSTTPTSSLRGQSHNSISSSENSKEVNHSEKHNSVSLSEDSEEVNPSEKSEKSSSISTMSESDEH